MNMRGEVARRVLDIRAAVASAAADGCYDIDGATEAICDRFEVIDVPTLFEGADSDAAWSILWEHEIDPVTVWCPRCESYSRDACLDGTRERQSPHAERVERAIANARAMRS